MFGGQCKCVTLNFKHCISLDSIVFNNKSHISIEIYCRPCIYSDSVLLWLALHNNIHIKCLSAKTFGYALEQMIESLNTLNMVLMRGLF